MASSKEKIFALITPDHIHIHTAQPTAIEKLGGIYCHLCNNIYAKKRSFDTHYRNQHQDEAGETVYSCVVCKKQITGYPSFRNHCYLNHVVKNKFQCEHCDKSFCKQSILNNHVAAVHAYKCSSCDQKFTSKNELNTHKSTHKKTVIAKTEPPYDCFKCGKLLKSIDMCEKHIQEHSEIVYTCPICNEELSTKAEAIQHLAVHYDDNLPVEDSKSSPSIDTSIMLLGGIRCCLCDMVLPNRAELDAHFHTEHDEKTIVYTCNVCGKQYDKYLMFGSHCHYHISRDKFECDECKRSFPRLSLLVIHMEAFHSDWSGSKPFPCDECKHGFMTRFRLREHKRIVHETDEFDYKCTHPGCFAVISNPRDAILHRKRHTSLEPWCHTCGLRLADARAAARHLDVHAAARLACPVCGRAYRQPHRLRPHLRAHYSALVHLCRVCGRTYSLLSRLLQHQRSHADSAARKHQCDLCPKAFDKPVDLQQHRNVHAGRRPYACAVCPRTFTNNPNWRKHLRRYHRLDAAHIERLRRERDAATRGTETDAVRDAKEIDAIVQDIQALSDDLARHGGDGTDAANNDAFMPIDSVLFDNVPVPVEASDPQDSLQSPESVVEYSELGLPHADDHILPHIDPLLTIKPDKMYVHTHTNTHTDKVFSTDLSEQKYNPVLAVGLETLPIVHNLIPMYEQALPMYESRGWEPTITKVKSESNDHAMFIC